MIKVGTKRSLDESERILKSLIVQLQHVGFLPLTAPKVEDFGRVSVNKERSCHVRWVEGLWWHDLTVEMACGRNGPWEFRLLDLTTRYTDRRDLQSWRVRFEDPTKMDLFLRWLEGGKILR